LGLLMSHGQKDRDRVLFNRRGRFIAFIKVEVAVLEVRSKWAVGQLWFILESFHFKSAEAADTLECQLGLWQIWKSKETLSTMDAPAAKRHQFLGRHLLE